MDGQKRGRPVRPCDVQDEHRTLPADRSHGSQCMASALAPIAVATERMGAVRVARSPRSPPIVLIPFRARTPAEPYRRGCSCSRRKYIMGKGSLAQRCGECD